MGYLGGKSRYCKEIAQVIRLKRRNHQPILEPFCGMAYVSQHLYPGPVTSSDICKPLILMHQAVQQGWEPPDSTSEEEYADLKIRWQEGEDSALIGFVGFGCSFSGKWFGGYARGNSRDYCSEAKRSLLKRHRLLTKVQFEHTNYKNLEPEGCVIYCDPPYGGSTGYEFGEWDSRLFWGIMRKWSEKNTVLISEYEAPSDFRIINEWSHFSAKGKTTERLFRQKAETYLKGETLG